LQKQDSNHLCGSSILDNVTLITAAHCVDGEAANEFTARVGTIFNSGCGQKFGIKSIHIHRKYKCGCRDNYDVAILKRKVLDIVSCTGVFRGSAPQGARDPEAEGNEA
jgi:trypsin